MTRLSVLVLDQGPSAAVLLLLSSVHQTLLDALLSNLSLSIYISPSPALSLSLSLQVEAYGRPWFEVSDFREKVFPHFYGLLSFCLFMLVVYAKCQLITLLSIGT